MTGDRAKEWCVWQGAVPVALQNVVVERCGVILVGRLIRNIYGDDENIESIPFWEIRGNGSKCVARRRKLQ